MKFLAIAAAALLTACAAVAQPHGMRGQGSHGAEGMPMMGMMTTHCRMMQRTEGALAFLKTELKITAAQERAWNAFADAYRTPHAAAHGGAGHGPGKGPHGKGAEPFPQAASRHVEMMEHHLARAKVMSDAAKLLYDALGAEQRKAADELLMQFVMMHCAM